MVVSGVLRLLSFAGTITAFTIRNESQLDSPAGTAEGATADTLPASVVATTWRPKVHGEHSADGWDASTTGGDNRVRIDAATTDFDVTVTTSTESRVSKESISFIDIGTIIQTLVPSTAWAVPTVHFEDSASDWDDATSTVHYESSATDWESVTSDAGRWEVSASGWDETGHEDLAPQSTRYRSVEVTDDPWTKNLWPSRTIVSAGPQVTEVPSKTNPDFSPPPAITHDGITVRPIAVTRKPTVTLPDGVVTTTEEVEFQVAIGSSILSIGNPVTINSVVFDVTIDAAGSTILHAGDLTTILPQPTAGEVRPVAGDTSEPFSIVTAVDRGTTKYVLAGQTLAPGKPVTIGGTPISITTSGGKTVLYVGDKTTTLSAAGDMQTLTNWATISVGTRGTAANTEPASAIPTSKGSGSSAMKGVDAAFACSFVGIALFAVTF